MDIVVQIIVGLLALGFLITIHELGHFLVAKWTKVKVNTFSIGFGPKILKYKWGETTYCISLIPFGGYVAMAGEDPSKDSGQSYSEGDFQNKPIWVRASIALAGPMVNILFAMALLLVIFMVGYPRQGLDLAVVGAVMADSPAEQAGIKVGDTLAKVNGKSIQKFQEFEQEIGMNLGNNVQVTLRRGQGEQNLQITPTEMKVKGQEMGVGDVGVAPAFVLIAASNPAPQTPAAQAGILANDTILQLNGKKVFGNLFDLVQETKGQPSQLLVGREKGPVLLNVQASAKTADQCPNQKACYMLGLPLRLPEHFDQYEFPAAFSHMLDESYEYAMMPFQFIGKILTGGIKLKAMSGPVGIVQVVGKTFTFGMVKFLLLVALISMNLGIMNLLPLAITDGGILLFLLIEAIRGKPLKPEVQIKIQQVAVAFFITLFLYVLFQDILRIPLFYSF